MVDAISGLQNNFFKGSLALHLVPCCTWLLWVLFRTWAVFFIVVLRKAAGNAVKQKIIVIAIVHHIPRFC